MVVVQEPARFRLQCPARCQVVVRTFRTLKHFERFGVENRPVRLDLRVVASGASLWRGVQILGDAIDALDLAMLPSRPDFDRRSSLR